MSLSPLRDIPIHQIQDYLGQSSSRPSFRMSRDERAMPVLDATRRGPISPAPAREGLMINRRGLFRRVHDAGKSMPTRVDGRADAA